MPQNQNYGFKYVLANKSMFFTHAHILLLLHFDCYYGNDEIGYIY